MIHKWKPMYNWNILWRAMSTRHKLLALDPNNTFVDMMIDIDNCEDTVDLNLYYKMYNYPFQ